MNITLSRDEYRTLLEMVELADWIINAHSERPERSEKYSELEQKLLQLAHEEGCGDFVTLDEEIGEYLPTNKLDDRIMPVIDDYDDETFWQELISRLAERDMARRFGPESAAEMEFVDRATKLEEIETQYASEFEENGLENVHVGNTRILNPSKN